MLLLLPVQLPGFGTFADTTAKEVVPGRMTYNSVIASGSYVCDPDWSGSDGSLVLGSSTVACNSACAKVIGLVIDEYDWCYTELVPSASSTWCWCKPAPLEPLKPQGPMVGPPRAAASSLYAVAFR